MKIITVLNEFFFSDEITVPYKVSFKATNTLPVPIDLIWKSGDIKRQATIAPGADVSIREPVTNDNQAVVFTAYESGTKNPVLINDNRDFSLRPTNDNSQQELRLSPGKMLKTRTL